MVEERVLEMTLISASNLKNMNFISKMETYVVVKLPPYFEYTSKVDSKGGVNPRWDESFGFMLPESVLQRGESRIKIEIYTLGTLFKQILYALAYMLPREHAGKAQWWIEELTLQLSMI